MCLIAALVLVVIGKIDSAGPLFIVFFIALAIGFRGFPILKRFGYTLMILAAVTTALYYPGYFVELNGFKFATLITPLLQIIMFGMSIYLNPLHLF